MDNFSIDVTAEEKETLGDLLRVCFRHNCPGGTVKHWAEVEVGGNAEWLRASDKRKALVLFWHGDVKGVRVPGGPFIPWDVQALPTPLDAVGALEIAWRWLEAADAGPAPDQDGDNEHGFRLRTDFWGHFEGCSYAVVGILPAWAMYGK